MAKKKRYKTPRIADSTLGNSQKNKVLGTLVDRSIETKLLYNLLRKKSPEDTYGVQKAYVDFDGDDDDSIVMPTKEQLSSPSSLGSYGLSTIVKMGQPFQIIPKISPQDVLYNVPKKEQPSVLRQLLRRIVDEV